MCPLHLRVASDGASSDVVGWESQRDSSEGNEDPGPILSLIWARLVINLFLQPSKCLLKFCNWINEQIPHQIQSFGQLTWIIIIIIVGGGVVVPCFKLLLWTLSCPKTKPLFFIRTALLPLTKLWGRSCLAASDLIKTKDGSCVIFTAADVVADVWMELNRE